MWRAKLDKVLKHMDPVGCLVIKRQYKEIYALEGMGTNNFLKTELKPEVIVQVIMYVPGFDNKAAHRLFIMNDAYTLILDEFTPERMIVVKGVCDGKSIRALF